MKNEKLDMNLQLFAEGEGAEAPSAGTQATGSAQGVTDGSGQTGAPAEGVSANPTREGRRQPIFPAVPRTDVRRVQPKAARPLPTATAPQQAQNEPQAQQAQETQEETFDSLIRGKYKKEYGQAVQAAVQERLKNRADNEEALRKANAVLASVAPFFGVEVGQDGMADIEKLSQAIQDDDRLYEEEALQKGIPVSTLKHIKQIEARERERQAEERRSLADEQLHRHYDGLQQQAEELKKKYPDFDLMTECQTNPTFFRMTAPGGGLTVEQAYMACHGEELLKRQAQQTEEKTKSNMSRAIQSGSIRPQENGMAQSGGGPMHRDPHTYTREERMEMRRRVNAGERVIP